MPKTTSTPTASSERTRHCAPVMPVAGSPGRAPASARPRRCARWSRRRRAPRRPRGWRPRGSPGRAVVARGGCSSTLSPGLAVRRRWPCSGRVCGAPPGGGAGAGRPGGPQSARRRGQDSKRPLVPRARRGQRVGREDRRARRLRGRRRTAGRRGARRHCAPCAGAPSTRASHQWTRATRGRGTESQDRRVEGVDHGGDVRAAGPGGRAASPAGSGSPCPRGGPAGPAVSTPSATTSMPRVRPSSTMLRTSAARHAGRPRCRR